MFSSAAFSFVVLPHIRHGRLISYLNTNKFALTALNRMQNMVPSSQLRQEKAHEAFGYKAGLFYLCGKETIEWTQSMK